MNILEGLAACAGSWCGTSTLQDPENDLHDQSSSSATVTPVLGGRFVRLDYTWSYRGTPQEGSLLIGLDAQADTVTIHWIDSWHMGDKGMACLGPSPRSATLSARGCYAAPPGPDWGWRIDVESTRGPGPASHSGEETAPNDEPTIRITMFNIWPDGREEWAVKASYTRVTRNG